MAKGVKTGGGSRKGIPNKLTRSVREAFEIAFNSLQDVPGAKLADWAEANPTEFYKLAAKLIPADVNLKADMRNQVKIVSEFADE